MSPAFSYGRTPGSSGSSSTPARMAVTLLTALLLVAGPCTGRAGEGLADAGPPAEAPLPLASLVLEDLADEALRRASARIAWLVDISTGAPGAEELLGPRELLMRAREAYLEGRREVGRAEERLDGALLEWLGLTESLRRARLRAERLRSEGTRLRAEVARDEKLLDEADRAFVSALDAQLEDEERLDRAAARLAALRTRIRAEEARLEARRQALVQALAGAGTDRGDAGTLTGGGGSRQKEGQGSGDAGDREEVGDAGIPSGAAADLLAFHTELEQSRSRLLAELAQRRDALREARSRVRERWGPDHRERLLELHRWYARPPEDPDWARMPAGGQHASTPLPAARRELEDLARALRGARGSLLASLGRLEERLARLRSAEARVRAIEDDVKGAEAAVGSARTAYASARGKAMRSASALTRIGERVLTGGEAADNPLVRNTARLVAAYRELLRLELAAHLWVRDQTRRSA